jgi:hypothetical protein
MIMARSIKLVHTRCTWLARRAWFILSQIGSLEMVWFILVNRGSLPITGSSSDGLARSFVLVRALRLWLARSGWSALRYSGLTRWAGLDVINGSSSRIRSPTDHIT